MKVVEYRGYELRVPKSWPVYQLSADPHRCVRYDVHAVYLGTPGANQDCPAGLVGRTETVSVSGSAPAPAPGHTASAVIVQRAPAAARAPAAGRGSAVQRAPAAGRGSAVQRATLPGRPAVITQDARQHELDMVLSAPSAPAITATYGTDPSLAKQVLASVHQMVYQNSARADPILKPVTDDVATVPAPASSGSPSSGSPSGSPPAKPAKKPMPGFDTCTAPSLATMRAWRSRFSATNIYIGGEEAACGYGNLTAQWVKSVKAMGWSLLPTYVGLQAPCDSFSGKINRKPASAAAQGKTDAQWAVQDAKNFGLGKGTPIYDDMEAYDANNQTCVKAVLTFLDAWTRELKAEGYVSGVYSSAGSGIVDLNTTTKINGHPFAEPQSLWFALWDNTSDLDGSPYLTGKQWSAAHLSKQYAGSRWVKVRKISLQVDLDLVNGATVR